MASLELKKTIQGYENYIEQDGIDDAVISAYCAAAEAAILSEKDVPYGLTVSARAKEIIEKYVLEQTEGTVWDLEKFSFANKTWYEILDKHYDILKLEAQNKVLDSYLLYLEKKREPKERFYAPKRKQFKKFGLIEAYQGCLDDLYDMICVSMPPGTGKAQPLYSKILTPNGFIPMGDIKIGAKVISGTGKVCDVIGVYPQGIKNVYEITFDDGSKCRCSDEHLWKVQTIEDRKRNNYRIIELKDMLNNYKRNRQFNYSVDYVPKMNISKNSLKVHPYLLGYLLGDGSFCKKNIGFATSDVEIVKKIKSILPENNDIVRDAKYNYRIKCNNGGGRGHKGELRIFLEEMGLFGKNSFDKFIPFDYLYSSYENRLELLRGLLDSDGSVNSRGYSIEFTSISRQLASDVKELVHSLGGFASISKKNSFYRNINGEKIYCHDHYRLTIQFMKDCENPFYLYRKANKFKPKNRGNKRFIHKIEYIGKEECQCIMVNDESHLYITDDYIITHNTTLLKFFASAVIGWFPRDYNLFYSHSGDITRMFYDGCLQIVQDDNEYSWREIFSDCSITSTNAKMGQFNINQYKPFPSLQTASVGSENAGKVRASKFLLVDDMIGKLEEALNKNTLEKLWGAYTVDARQRKTMDSEDKPCKEVINATRWSTGDVIGRVIKMYAGNPRVKVIAMPDIDPVTGKSNFDYEYGGFTVAFFNDQAHLMDDISYRCLFKQEPIEREGLLFPEDKVQRYKELPDTKIKYITGQGDCKGKGTDYFVLPCLYEFEGHEGMYYCVDTVCNNSADYEYQYESATNVIVDNKMNDCEFESNMGGDRVALEVKKRVEQKGWICNITDRATETNKEARIFQCSNWIMQHVIFKDKSLYDTKSQYGVMMALLLGYSVSAGKQLDDVPDVFSNFAIRMTKGKRRKKARIMEGLL